MKLSSQYSLNPDRTTHRCSDSLWLLDTIHQWGLFLLHTFYENADCDTASVLCLSILTYLRQVHTPVLLPPPDDKRGFGKTVLSRVCGTPYHTGHQRKPYTELRLNQEQGAQTQVLVGSVLLRGSYDSQTDSSTTQTRTNTTSKLPEHSLLSLY